MDLESVNIVCATDDNYAEICAVMLYSLLECNTDLNFNIFVITSNLSQDKSVKISDVVVGRFNQKLSLVEVDENLFADFPLNTTIPLPLSTYYRLALAHLMPDYVSKLIYLDIDIIVRGSIRELWETDMKGLGLGAVLDANYSKAEPFERLDITPDYGYFCAGVLLIDLDYWRKHDVYHASCELAKTKPDKLLFHDQDILNVLFHGKWHNLSFRWDFMAGHQKYRSERDFMRDLDKKSKYYPIIIHYTETKPWKSKGYNLFQRDFDDYYFKALGRKNDIPTYSFKRLVLSGINKLLGSKDWRAKYKWNDF